MFRHTNVAGAGVELVGSTLRLWGEVDYELATVVADTLEARLGLVRGALLVDAADVTFMDSAGLALLVRTTVVADRVVLLRASEHVRDILAVTGAHGLFHADPREI
ncbi:STAS domain-containing protein [Cellulosimicrobium cellulans]|uniref:STAS domain-containing protein n=1 Tax=Cellulosimicrobium cellulans TaxID=1710 RepID=UPI00196526B8|nr:STAS domain-containing protein [Cellulosimicrobium cellulans]MBN0040861.1 STAS domain-containing protein [Cellulosimicrobium cellulans]